MTEVHVYKMELFCVYMNVVPSAAQLWKFFDYVYTMNYLRRVHLLWTSD